LALVVLLGLLAACSADGEGTSSTTTSAATAPVTAEELAAIVAARGAELSDVIDAARVCLDGYQFPCTGEAAINVYRVSLQASLLAGDLRPGDTVPAEIEELLERTMAATEAALAHAEAFSDGNCGPQPGDSREPAESCATTAQNALLANNELKAVLDAWAPYG
jgi:hypothetical protein